MSIILLPISYSQKLAISGLDSILRTLLIVVMLLITCLIRQQFDWLHLLCNFKKSFEALIIFSFKQSSEERGDMAPSDGVLSNIVSPTHDVKNDSGKWSIFWE